MKTQHIKVISKVFLVILALILMLCRTPVCAASTIPQEVDDVTTEEELQECKSQETIGDAINNAFRNALENLNANPLFIFKDLRASILESKKTDFFVDGCEWLYSYEDNDGGLPYHVLSPSIESSEPIPLIVWLHGSGERNVVQQSFKNRGAMPTLLNWSSVGAEAYILCPQLAGKHSVGVWNAETSAQQLKAILDVFIEENNVDVDRIYISGHSLGGQGCLYMAANLPEYFAACASLSPYESGANIKSISMPLVAFVGERGSGEDNNSISYAIKLGQIIGEDNVTFLWSSHGDLPRIAFEMDNDMNGRSDILEWFFSISKSK